MPTKMYADHACCRVWQVDELQRQVIGQTLVRLVGDREVCRARECNLGNLIADATLRGVQMPTEGQWSQVRGPTHEGHCSTTVRG